MPSDTSNISKPYFTRNLPLKLLSIAVAICIWCFISFSRENSHELTAQVQLKNIPQGLTVSSALPREIRVSVSGTSFQVFRLRRHNPALTLDLNGVNSGKTTFSHLETYLNLPSGVKSTRVTPSTIEIELVNKN